MAETHRTTLTFVVDMLDVSHKNGSHLRLKPEEGHPFWLEAFNLPDDISRRVLRMNAKLLVVFPNGTQANKVLKDGITGHRFYGLLLTNGIELRAA